MHISQIVLFAGRVLETGTQVTALAALSAGLLAFFSPCVLPIVPLYMAYFAGGADLEKAESEEEEKARRIKVRKNTMLNTVFFVLGISSVYVILGLAATAAGEFFNKHGSTFSKVGGIIVIVLGVLQLIFAVKGGSMGQEKRMNFDWGKFGMNPLTAFILGFSFSFAWTPCVGPMLLAVIAMVANAANRATGFAYMAVYTLGFTIPFLLLGFFTDKLLNYLQGKTAVLKYTSQAGAVLMIIIGIMMLTGLIGA